MRYLVTGAAGFIGFFACQRLLARGDEVIGLDNLNAYYDRALKEARLARLAEERRFTFHRLDLVDSGGVERLFRGTQPNAVVNLAAQAGVRYSLANPQAYVDSNLVGFANVLEGCRHAEVQHLVFASSSSVYGANTKVPFSVRDNVDHPISLYAATKKANELLAHAYSDLYGLPATGLRFFTVYGPWGRPDMAYFLFTRAILEDQPINVYNHGDMRRDFTYIDDVVECLVRVLDRPPDPNPQWAGVAPDPGTSRAPYRILNVGNNRPVGLLQFISVLERCLGRRARVNLLPLQAGDVPETYAEVDDLIEVVGWRPTTQIEVGLPRFVDWYRAYYRT